MNYPVLSSKICFLNVLQMDKTAMKFLGWKERRRREVQGKREGGRDGGKWTHPFGSFVVAVTKAIHF